MKRGGVVMTLGSCVLSSWTIMADVGVPPSGGAEPPKGGTPTTAGDQVAWTYHAPQKQLADPSWGAFLTDVENHLPIHYGSTYRDADKVTWCHETTHGINSHLRNRLGGAGRNVFYVGHNCCAIVEEPRLTLGQVALAVPPALRGSRYNLYLEKQRSQWDRDPLYLWDEWVAYTNGARTALDLAKRGQARRDDCLVGMLEFDVYALYLVKLAQENHSDTKQLLEFFAWNWRRSFQVMEVAKQYPILDYDQGTYLRTMLAHPQIRQFIAKNQILSR